MTAAACCTSAWCVRCASSTACWICTFGSAYSSIFAPNSAIRYLKPLVKGFAIVRCPLSPPVVCAARTGTRALPARLPSWQASARSSPGLGDNPGSEDDKMGRIWHSDPDDVEMLAGGPQDRLERTVAVHRHGDRTLADEVRDRAAVRLRLAGRRGGE